MKVRMSLNGSLEMETLRLVLEAHAYFVRMIYIYELNALEKEDNQIPYLRGPKEVLSACKCVKNI